MEAKGSKDHKPGTFERKDGYRSDLENMEMEGKRVNTSFGSANHNAYIHLKDGTHAHFWYDPAKLQCGYHGENYATKNNHPKAMTEKQQGGDHDMKNRDSFVKDIKASEEVQTKINAVLKNYQKQQGLEKTKTEMKDNGRERGNESKVKGSEGREPGLKTGGNVSKGTGSKISAGKGNAGGNNPGMNAGKGGLGSGGGNAAVGGKGAGGKGTGGKSAGGGGKGSGSI